jgi:CDP-diacylglycerol--serine O-phosphatidyltransferase
LWDPANLVTLLGLLCGISSIYCSCRHLYTAATVALLWALFCDWFDGPIARRMSNRTDLDRAFGGQLDSLCDLVCSGVAPGVLLLAIGEFDLWFLPGAMVLALAGAIRLAHFNVSGGEDTYSGLPIDTNLIVVTALFAVRGLVDQDLFPWLLYAAVALLAIGNVASFRTPKPSRLSYYAVAGYVVGMTVFHIT